MIRSGTAAPEAQAEERRAPPSMGAGKRLLAFSAASYDADAHTVEAVLSTGAAVKRWGFVEMLDISPEAIDLNRVLSGQCKLLDTHDQYEIDAIIGTVQSAEIRNGALVATLKFGATDRARQAEGMVERGELTGVSIGYMTRAWAIQSIDETTNVETWLCTSWELTEVSFVPVPADPTAGVRSAAPAAGTLIEEEDKMKRSPEGAGAPVVEVPAAAAPAAAAPIPEAARAAPAPAPAPAATPAVVRMAASEVITMLDQARSLGVEERARALIAQNEAGEIGPDTVRANILQAAGEHQRAQVSVVTATPGLRVSNGNADASRAAIADAIVARVLGTAPSDPAREYMGRSLLDLARERAGLNPREQDPDIIIRAANTTSDFPLTLEAAANKVLMNRYTAAAPTYQSIAQRRDLTDFKVTKLLRMGDFPTLLPYAEDGEIKAGTINEGRETVILGSYGRRLLLTRQAIINDDLGAFDDMFTTIGRVVARFENNTFYAMKAANSGNGPKLSDGVNLFNAATHKNLAASGSAITIASVGAGRAAMRKQVDLDGNAINIAPKILLTGPDKETEADQFVASILANQLGNVNPFSGKLSVEVDPALTGNAWELYADPADLAVFNYGYLRSAPGPKVLYQEGFTHDGMAWRVSEDFYCGVVDYRGAYRDPGN